MEIFVEKGTFAHLLNLFSIASSFLPSFLCIIPCIISKKKKREKITNLHPRPLFSAFREYNRFPRLIAFNLVRKRTRKDSSRGEIILGRSILLPLTVMQSRSSWQRKTRRRFPMADDSYDLYCTRVHHLTRDLTPIDVATQPPPLVPCKLASLTVRWIGNDRFMPR